MFWKKKNSCNWRLAETNWFNYIHNVTAILINLHVIGNLIICLWKSCYKLHWTAEVLTLFFIYASSYRWVWPIMKDAKMTTLFSKMVFIVFFYGVVDLAIHSKSSAQPHSAFIEIQEILTIRTFTGKRLYSRDAEVFDRDVFTNFQCLDICLRTEQCASVDVKETNSKKLCRVNRSSQFHYLENKDNWSHINISGKDLRKVSLDMRKSV